jgi:hypothetical protein
MEQYYNNINHSNNKGSSQRATIIFVNLTPERCREVQPKGNNNTCKLNCREMQRIAAQGKQSYLQTQLQRDAEKCSPRQQ